MRAEFSVEQCYNIGGVSLVVVGTLENGEIGEGDVGVTSKTNKRFTVVKIEKEGITVPKAYKTERVNLTVKNIYPEEILPGERFLF